jgi:hypothetical protein
VLRLRRERGTIVRSRRLVDRGGRPLKLIVRQCCMTDANWVSVAEYADPPSAQVVSQRLTVEGIPNRVVSGFIGSTYPSPGSSLCYIWVPPELADKARQILREPAISEGELAALALRFPPPDDA